MEKLKIINLPEKVHRALGEALGEDGEVISRSEVLSGIANFIILCIEPVTVMELSDFLGLMQYDGDGIFLIAEEILSGEGEFSYERRKGLIEESLSDCFSHYREINFSGFLNFRLGKYIDLLYKATINAAFSYYKERG